MKRARKMRQIAAASCGGACSAGCGACGTAGLSAPGDAGPGCGEGGVSAGAGAALGELSADAAGSARLPPCATESKRATAKLRQSRKAASFGMTGEANRAIRVLYTEPEAQLLSRGGYRPINATRSPCRP